MVAVAVPLVWLAWMVLTDWVPMYPLNDLARSGIRERLLAAAINYPFPLAIAAGVALAQTWSFTAALVLCALCLIGHVRSWWLPYFRGAGPAQRDLYERLFARTVKVLPTQGHDVVIDVQHMVTGVLALTMTATTITATIAG
ncbi:hypothetical protein [Pseudonocardia sp. TRM90224]|uniref:hypothetical protein n=1 Tax=Pseudonocardia sp. TRM90224 TaxID=2812678 RepID=UPI001E31E622|nr:hypothetical protein [Pseudonocardia sp. TRM90224]